MSESQENYSEKFYDKSFYQNEILLNNNAEENNNSQNFENNHIIYYPEIKDRFKNMISIIENNINNWKKDMLNHFENINQDFNCLKEYIYEIIMISEQDSSISNKTIKNDINNINFNLKKYYDSDKENSEKSQKSFCHNQRNKCIVLDFEKIEEFLKKIKDFNFSEITTKYRNRLYQNISDIKTLIELNDKKDLNANETKLDKSFELEKKEFIQKAESFFGLDNQFDIITYEEENHLLIHIDNFNDLFLKLINKENIIVKTLIIKKIFEDEIREIRHFSNKYKDIDKHYLLVSSRKNEIKIFEIIINSEKFENTLKEINHLTEIYKNEKMNIDLFDLSSSIIRFKENFEDSEIYITCWEGHSIKIYNLFNNICIKEIISKSSCNIKFCNIFEDKYLIFCGCNSQDNYTCANRTDLDKLDYNIEKDENVPFLKFLDKSEDNKENIFFI